ncbi:MAG: copper oxidase [Candidatus Methanoperedenaceae archaeon]|nr:MAG: copper oxidase [Candidatus Methanoperedenaceae archaeon]
MGEEIRIENSITNDAERKNDFLKMDRRTFVKVAGGVAGAIAFGGLSGHLIQRASAAAGTPNITKFVDPLLSSIPKLIPVANDAYPGADYYEIEMKPGRFQFSSQLPVTALAGINTTWGYGGRDLANKGPLVFLGYLGPTIEAQKGKTVVVKFINNLPTTHPLQASIDPTVPDPAMYSDLYDTSTNPPTPIHIGRTTPHLHGGFTAPQFDGHPHSWFTPISDGGKGSHYATLSGAAANEAIFVFSNQQPATNLWYHDHAMGITRLNVYAGLAGLYFVRDQYDTGTSNPPTPGLNLPAGNYEVPLVLQDKQFNADGTLFYPTVGITAVHPIWMPEFFGDTPVVNGTAYPFLSVEPRRYRFRILNGSQARFYNLWFDNGLAPIPFHLIGMEQSLVPTPVAMTKLLIAPGERADIIVDFAGMQNQMLTLKNNAKAPYPGGKGGFGQIMQVRVNLPMTGTDTTTPAANLVLPQVPRLTGATIMREIVMKEDVDPVTGLPIDMKLNGKWFNDLPIDETPTQNATEVWQFINLTVDAHPMHMHLVKFQVSDRQPFDAKAYTTAWLKYQAGLGSKPILANFLTKGPAVLPPPEEMGWKDTAKSYPGEILRVIAKFELPDADSNIPGSGTQLPAEYVYHCHILEHEENEMMRPFTVG